MTAAVNTAASDTDAVVGAESGRVARLAAEAGEAAQVRALTTHPDVIALRVEKVRTQVDRLLWAGIVLGLAFTTVNVQAFAAHGAVESSAAWWVAWLLDPMVSLVLLAVLRAEQVTARYQVALNAWARRTKWLTFAATYVMNTWTSWGLAGAPFSAAGVVLHSVPPLVVFFSAETGPGLRDRLTEAVRRSMTEHTATASTADVAPAAGETVADADRAASVHDRAHGAVHESGTNTVPAPRRRPARRKPAPAPRRLLADYVSAARAALEQVRVTGEPVEITPAWCRRVTGCSAGTSVKVAAALRQPVRITESVPVEARRAA
ncbi:MAG: hypothetical protein AB7L91_18575 [Dehalococcoidia bacterium]